MDSPSNITNKNYQKFGTYWDHISQHRKSQMNPNTFLFIKIYLCHTLYNIMHHLENIQCKIILRNHNLFYKCLIRECNYANIKCN